MSRARTRGKSRRSPSARFTPPRIANWRDRVRAPVGVRSSQFLRLHRVAPGAIFRGWATPDRVRDARFLFMLLFSGLLCLAESLGRFPMLSSGSLSRVFVPLASTHEPRSLFNSDLTTCIVLGPLTIWGRTGFDRETRSPRACRRVSDVTETTNSTADLKDQQGEVLAFPAPAAELQALPLAA